jgi:chromate transporter
MDVFLTFLRLGSTSFGGPIAHLGYFRREIVERRSWLSAEDFTQIVAFCSALPGPTSSQVGMLVGLVRGGSRGAFLAWLGFTVPSAIAMTLVGLFASALSRGAGTGPMWFGGLLVGLSAAAAAVVAQAVLTMASTQCRDRETATIALGAAILTLALQPLPGAQWVPIAVGAIVGALFLRRGVPIAAPLPIAISRLTAIASALVFIAIVGFASVFANASDAGAFCATIVRAGSLVFGGGHVVLPLLQGVVGEGFLSARDFFAGYGAVQAVPGPLFTFAAFLGSANLTPLHGVLGALVALVLIFAPSFALVFALAPVWNRLRAIPAASGALAGANAAVVGLLGAVLYSPILTSLGTSSLRIAIALCAFALVAIWKVSPWIVVVGAAAFGACAALAGAIA